MKKTAARQLKAIEFEAFKALSGADYVRQRLLHGLSMGTPSLEGQAYLIKSRVKEAGSLVAKVLDRREKNKHYSPENVRDIVGLRILALFKSEQPLLLNRFLDFVRWSQRSPFSLFFGHELRECIEEIVIYPVADEYDPNLGFFLEEFEKYGFLPSDDPESLDPTAIRIRKKRSRYSSIHLVLWANGPTQSYGDRVPVEVQLRTSLEDVWGEIEHRLKYKSKFAVQKTKRGAARSDRFDDLELVHAELENLKMGLDIAGNTADLLRRRIDSDVSDGVAIKAYRKNVSFDMNVINHIGLPDVIMDIVGPVLPDLLTLYKHIFGQQDLDRDYIDWALVALRRGTAAFGDALRLNEESSANRADHDMIEYHLRMEKALCLYWSAVMLHGRISGDGTLKEDREAQAALNQAFAHYHRASRLPGYTEDPVVFFRLANAISLGGDHDYALLKYAEAYLQLGKDGRLSQSHQMRIIIPRQYAQSLWHAAERAKWKSAELGDVDLFRPRRLDQYIEALDVSLGLYGKKVDEMDIDGRSMAQEEENRVTANNIVEYACSFLEAGGDGRLLRERNITPDRMRELADEVSGRELQKVQRTSFADTVRKSARILGDRSSAVTAARRVLELLEQKDFSVALPDMTYVEVKRLAEDEIATGTNPVEGYPLAW